MLPAPCDTEKLSKCTGCRGFDLATKRQRSLSTSRSSYATNSGSECFQFRRKKHEPWFASPEKAAAGDGAAFVVGGYSVRRASLLPCLRPVLYRLSRMEQR